MTIMITDTAPSITRTTTSRGIGSGGGPDVGSVVVVTVSVVDSVVVV